MPDPSPTSPCSTLPDVATWLIGSLGSVDAQRVEEHVARCPACRAAAQSLAPLVLKLPGDDAPSAEPPPELKTRIMDVVRSEARRPARDEAIEVPATVSISAAPRTVAALVVRDGAGQLVASGLPRPSAGVLLRVWFLGGPRPHVPHPGPVVQPAPDGSATWDLGPLDGWDEVLVALEGDGLAAGAPPLLRARLPYAA